MLGQTDNTQVMLVFEFMSNALVTYKFQDEEFIDFIVNTLKKESTFKYTSKTSQLMKNMEDMPYLKSKVD